MKFGAIFILFFTSICVSLSAQERIYFNDFESGDLNVDTYEGNPEIAPNISSTEWTNDSNSGFLENTGEGGSRAISVKQGTVNVYFDIVIEPGYQLNITGYKFWVKKAMANSAWTLFIDSEDTGVNEGGNTGTEGAFMEGDLTFLNLRGTINFEFKVNGLGNGFYIIDNFEIFGEVVPICDEPLITTQPNSTNVCSGDQVSFQVETISGEEIIYQWQILVDGTWEDLTNDQNYSGVNTAVLNIEDTPLTFDQNRYRCLVFIDGCEEESQEAELNVIALPKTEPIIYNN